MTEQIDDKDAKLTDSLCASHFGQNNEWIALFKHLTSAVAIGPTVKMRYGWSLWEIGIQEPIYDEGSVFVGGIFWSNNKGSK